MQESLGTAAFNKLIRFGLGPEPKYGYKKTKYTLALVRGTIDSGSYQFYDNFLQGDSSHLCELVANGERASHVITRYRYVDSLTTAFSLLNVAEGDEPPI